MRNKLIEDRSGNTSSKRTIMLMAAAVVIILAFLMGLVYLYGLIFLNKQFETVGIISLCSVLSGLITLLSTMTLFEKKDSI